MAIGRPVHRHHLATRVSAVVLVRPSVREDDDSNDRCRDKHDDYERHDDFTDVGCAFGKVEVRLDGGSKVRPVASACRDCGVILDLVDRQFCDACLPDYDRERTKKLLSAGKATLAAMRASPGDPARSPEVTAKKREKSRSTSLAMRAWEREHGVGDSELYDREVLPRIWAMTVPQLMKLTGLSQFHCWKVRKGERRLHARHWEAILLAVERSSG